MKCVFLQWAFTLGQRGHVGQREKLLDFLRHWSSLTDYVLLFSKDVFPFESLS